MNILARIIPDISLNKLRDDLFNSLAVDEDQPDRFRILDHKYFYWDYRCAERWRSLVQPTQDEDWLTHQQSTDMVEKCFEQIHENVLDLMGQPYDLFSLGVGVGQDDAVMLKTLSRHLRSISYHPNTKKALYLATDISMHLINHSLSSIKQASEKIFEHIEVVILNVDFQELNKYEVHLAKKECRRNPRLLCLLGSTLGNYNEKDLLTKIVNIMSEVDYLVLGVDCPIDEWSENDIVSCYKGLEKGYDFLLGPVESAVNNPFSSHWSKVQKQNRIPAKISDEHLNAFGLRNQIPYSRDVYHELDLSELKRGKVGLNKSTKYKFNSLLNWLRNTLFLREEIVLKPSDVGATISKGTNYCLIVLRKMSKSERIELIKGYQKESTEKVDGEIARVLSELIKKIKIKGKVSRKEMDQIESIAKEIMAYSNGINEARREDLNSRLQLIYGKSSILKRDFYDVKQEFFPEG